MKDRLVTCARCGISTIDDGERPVHCALCRKRHPKPEPKVKPKPKRKRKTAA